MKKLVLFLLLFVRLFVPVGISQDSTDELLAAQYFRDGEYEKAVVLYEALMKSNPGRVVYNNYMESLFALEEFRKAERVVRGLIKDNPLVISYEVDLGWVLLRSGDERRGRRHLDGLIRNLQPSARDVIALAGAFQQRRMNELALETYLRGRRIVPDPMVFHLNIAALYDRMGRYEQMMEEYLDYMNNNLRELEYVRGLLQDAINNDPGFERNEALRKVLLSRTQSSPQNTLYSEMLLWLSIQQKRLPHSFYAGQSP
jgi:tetratricopeptide (TPR) repeat protein